MTLLEARAVVLAAGGHSAAPRLPDAAQLILLRLDQVTIELNDLYRRIDEAGGLTAPLGGVQ